MSANNDQSKILPCPFLWMQLFRITRRKMEKFKSKSKESKLCKERPMKWLNQVPIKETNQRIERESNDSSSAFGTSSLLSDCAPHGGSQSHYADAATDGGSLLNSCTDDLPSTTFESAELFTSQRAPSAHSARDTISSPSTSNKRTLRKHGPDFEHWQQLIVKTQDALTGAQELRDEVNADISDLKQMRLKTEDLSREVVSLNQRMDVMTNRWKFLDQIIKRAEEAGNKITLLDIPAEKKLLNKYRKHSKKKTSRT